ncbi:MAG: hypothetical protein KIS94_04835 [Chitinophagales bacterium]|nr:hypothetical protein [Chitinophagales bacterium]
MVHVASEMERLGFKQPLLIGGATTSKIHTAVKIAPAYSGNVVHVLDASKSVTVASSLLSDDQQEKFSTEVKAEYAELRDAHAKRRSDVEYVSLEEARKNRPILTFPEGEGIVTPNILSKSFVESYLQSDDAKKNGAFSLPSGGLGWADYSLDELSNYIDWSPFFSTWQMNGTYPRIFESDKYGKEAKKLFDDAQALLKKVIAEKWITAKGVIGIYPTCPLTPEGGTANAQPLASFTFMRQQTKKSGQPNLCLADFVQSNNEDCPETIHVYAPTQTPPSGAGGLGFFAVTAGLNIEKKIAEFEKQHDDYNSIMLKALADRLAEAFAERMHERVRKEFWGYAADENLSNEDLIREKYQGIRPAPGYPACPDHTLKPQIWELLNVEKNTGIKLTESYAMYPAASVSGFYFASPHAKYFGVGKIQRDQVESLAKAKGISVEEMEKWLRPNLGY